MYDKESTMFSGAPCSLLRLARNESARITACFHGAGLLDGAAADPAALAAAAEADGSTASHADAPNGVDSNDGSAALMTTSTGAEAPGVEGVREASWRGTPQESVAAAQPGGPNGGSGPGVREASTAVADSDHAGVQPGRDYSTASGVGQYAPGGAGEAGTQTNPDAERGRQLRRVQDWVPEPDQAQVEPLGRMAAVLCPWQTPKEAAALLLMLARA